MPGSFPLASRIGIWPAFGFVEATCPFNLPAFFAKPATEAYGTTFPLPDGATARRMNDQETAATAAAIATAADHFKSDLDKDKALAKPDKDAAKKDVELLIKQADAVKSRTSDGKPATAEVQQLVAQAAKLQTFVGDRLTYTILVDNQGSADANNPRNGVIARH